MLRRVATSVVQARGLKNQAKVSWVRPDFIPAYKPERSGDLEGLPQISEDTLGLDYALSKEIKDAPEAVKKMFSVGFLGRKEFKNLVKKELMEKVKRHQYDDSNTAESRIARITAQIRCLQETLEKYPKNVGAKVTAQELIDKRKKLLKFLRQEDYKKFEWLLEELNIEYKAHPESYHKLTRKESLRKLTEMHCDDICNSKLNEYRHLLESQQGPFLRDKLEALKFIRSEQMELQLPVTITEKDIKQVEKQLEEWSARDAIKQAKKKKRDLAIGFE